VRVSDDDAIMARPTAFYPQPKITPGEFEEFVAGQLLGRLPEVSNLTVTVHERITGADGAYDFDATVRYQFAGMSFLVVVEAKNPIKRELVQILRQKALSVGAHKGVMVSTSPDDDDYPYHVAEFLLGRPGAGLSQNGWPLGDAGRLTPVSGADVDVRCPHGRAGGP
jgi:hypothetical protein